MSPMLSLGRLWRHVPRIPDGLLVLSLGWQLFELFERIAFRFGPCRERQPHLQCPGESRGDFQANGAQRGIGSRDEGLDGHADLAAAVHPIVLRAQAAIVHVESLMVGTHRSRAVQPIRAVVDVDGVPRR